MCELSNDAIAMYDHFRVRELTTSKIGCLLKITGQVVRTHPVHPELVTGTFICLDCQTVIKDVEQQFKYTQVRGRGGKRTSTRSYGTFGVGLRGDRQKM